MTAVLAWWAVTSALGLAAWPLAARTLGGLPARGYAQARAVGVVLLTYLHWLPATLGAWGNDARSLWLAAGVLLLGGGALWLRERGRLATAWHEDWRHILVVEALYLATLCLGAAQRAYAPSILHTEQPMDYALLTSAMRSPTLPPQDPWFAGEPLNYYYLGYQVLGNVARLGGLGPGVAYNLGLAGTLALVVSGAYGLLAHLAGARAGHPGRALLAPAAGAVAIAGAGNLEVLLEGLRALGLAGPQTLGWFGVPGLREAAAGAGVAPWWWRASRVISDANFLGRDPTVITEFPAFSFVLGDLHPHVMGLPFLLLGVAVALDLALRRGPASLPWLGPLLLGFSGAANAWDLPTLWVLMALGLLAGALRRREKVLPGADGGGATPPAAEGDNGAGRLSRTRGMLAWLLGGSVLAYLPFYLRFRPPTGGLAFHYYAWTPLGHYLLCLGPWVLLPIGEAGAGLVRAWRAQTLRRAAALGRGALLGTWGALLVLPWVVGLAVGGVGRVTLGLVFALAGGPWLLLALSGLLAVYAVRAWRLTRRGEAPLAEILILVGLGLTYAAEFLFVRDVFETRMNTVFKLYYQAWVLLGLGAWARAQRLWQRDGWPRRLAGAWALLVGLTLLYPIAAGWSVTQGYAGPPRLDGTAYLSAACPAEARAIALLSREAAPSEALAEAPGTSYTVAHNRVSAWSGMPSVLGWTWHERQWRGAPEALAAREADLQAIYTSPDPAAVRAALERYGVRWVWLGAHEAERYGAGAERATWLAQRVGMEVVLAEGDAAAGCSGILLRLTDG